MRPFVWYPQPFQERPPAHKIMMEKVFFAVALIAMVVVHRMTSNITYAIGTFAGLYTILLCIRYALKSRQEGPNK